MITEKPQCKISQFSLEVNTLTNKLELHWTRTPKTQKLYKPLSVLLNQSLSPKMILSLCTEMELNKILIRELKSLKDKLKLLNQTMTEKNWKKDWPSLREVSESSRSAVDPKLKSVKSRTELLTLFVPPRLPLQKVSYQEEEQLFSMPQKSLTSFLKVLKTLLKEKLQVLESFKTLSESHCKLFARMLVSKDL